MIRKFISRVALSDLDGVIITHSAFKLLDLDPEFKLPPAQKQAWLADRRGAIVGESLATRFGWKIGDTIPLQATIFPTKGSNDWPFTLRGIYKVDDPKQKGQERVMFFHWKYFDEANDYVKGRIGWFVVAPDSGAEPGMQVK